MSYGKCNILLAYLACQLCGCAVQVDEGTVNLSCAIEQVTFEPHDTYQFQGVSQDGRWLSVAWSKRDESESRGAYLLELETMKKTKLPQRFNNTGSFSPNGRWLVGAHYITENNTDIFIYDRDGKRSKSISPHGSYDFLPSFSPDNETILFNAFRSGNSELVLVDWSTGNIKQVTDNDVYDAHGEFSPDGHKILFHRMVRQRPSGGYDFDLYSIDLNDHHEIRLTQSPFEESYGSWAPDNQTIVFSSDFKQSPEQSNLYIRTPSGRLLRLTQGDWKDSYSYWTRDGRYIYFNSDRAGVTNIVRLPMQGLVCKTA
ncbi:MAG: hypothetical protein AAF438_03000 [Pseudomonadota bacterium]